MFRISIDITSASHLKDKQCGQLHISENNVVVIVNLNLFLVFSTQQQPPFQTLLCNLDNMQYDVISAS